MNYRLITLTLLMALSSPFIGNCTESGQTISELDGEWNLVLPAKVDMLKLYSGPQSIFAPYDRLERSRLIFWNEKVYVFQNSSRGYISDYSVMKSEVKGWMTLSLRGSKTQFRFNEGLLELSTKGRGVLKFKKTNKAVVSTPRSFRSSP